MGPFSPFKERGLLLEDWDDIDWICPFGKTKVQGIRLVGVWACRAVIHSCQGR